MRKRSRRYYFHGVQAQNAKKPPGNFFDSVLAILGSLSELCLDVINILCSSAPSDVTDHMTDNNAEFNFVYQIQPPPLLPFFF